MERDTNGREWHQSVGDPAVTAVEVLAEVSGLSRQAIREAMDKGAVWLERGSQGGRGGQASRVRRIRRRNARLSVGDQLHLYHDPEVLAEQPLPATLIADLGRYSVWDKPAGMRSQGSRWGDHTTLMRWAEKRLMPQRPAFTVHRLDRAASGLMLVAHDKKMAAALSGRFRERRIDKRYRVEVHGCFPADDGGLAFDADIDGRSAASRARRLSYDVGRGRSVLDVSIDTGRKHQIRRHLAGAGYPVVGDRLYGPTGATEDLRLRAWRLGLECPLSGERRVFELAC